jgi:predicted tellurium resistance membrane protein TerC
MVFWFAKEILLYGVLGAIVLRTLFIFIGAWFVQEFSWVLYIINQTKTLSIARDFSSK